MTHVGILTHLRVTVIFVMFFLFSVRPTKLELTGVRSYVVQGTNVLLHCNVIGARPEAHVTWYNGSEPITSDLVQSSSVISVSTFTLK